MRVLVAFERSGKVRSAFRRRGHDAWSCDIEPADDGDDHHLQMDAILAAYSRGPWDLMIAHPVCTFLCNSGAKHLYAGMKKENGPDPDRWARLGGALKRISRSSEHRSRARRSRIRLCSGTFVGSSRRFGVRPKLFSRGSLAIGKRKRPGFRWRA